MSTNNSTEILNTTQIADKHYRIGVMKRREQEDVEEAHDVTLLEQSSNAYVDASDIAQCVSNIKIIFIIILLKYFM